MRRSLGSAAMMLAILGLTVGCSRHGDYCDAVESAQPQLMDFGERTTEAYGTYARISVSIAEVAPQDIASKWTAIAKATGAVAAEQRSAGIDLADMSKPDKVERLSAEEVADLNEVYEAFNETQDARKSVVKDVKERCGIELAKKKRK